MTAYLDLIVIYCADLERARRTWQLITGREPEQHDGPVWFMLGGGGVVELYPCGDQPPTRTRLQITVTDAAAVADAVRETGVEVHSRTWGSELVDGGVVIDLRQPKIPGYMVTGVEAVGPTTLRVSHRNGTRAEHDLTRLIASGGIFAQLADPALFKRVYVDHGVVA
jgi:Protein of unknown function (DUF2442)